MTEQLKKYIATMLSEAPQAKRNMETEIPKRLLAIKHQFESIVDVLNNIFTDWKSKNGDINAIPDELKELLLDDSFVSQIEHLEQMADNGFKSGISQEEDLEPEATLNNNSYDDVKNNPQALAQLVQETADSITSPPGKYGDRKVFIIAIAEKLAVSNINEFKRKLVELNQKGLIELARADLVSAMDPDMVLKSEIKDSYSTFNFVISPNPRIRR